MILNTFCICTNRNPAFEEFSCNSIYKCSIDTDEKLVSVNDRGSIAKFIFNAFDNDFRILKG